MSTTELYRHFDENGVLLYLGISISTMTRLRGHKSSSHWFNKIERIQIERFPTREEAERAEFQAIVNEKPLHNIRSISKGVDSMGFNETARALGIDPKTLRKWVKEGVCPVAPIAGIEPPVWRRIDVEGFVGGAV